MTAFTPELRDFFNYVKDKAKTLSGQLTPLHLALYLVEGDFLKVTDKQTAVSKLSLGITSYYGSGSSESVKIIPETRRLFEDMIADVRRRGQATASIADLTTCVVRDNSVKDILGRFVVMQGKAQVVGGKWSPSPEMTDHAGYTLSSDALEDFFVVPPQEIGEVQTAFTSMNKTDKPIPQDRRNKNIVAFVAGGIVLATLLNIIFSRHRLGIALDLCGGISFGGTAAFIYWWKTRFWHKCSFVGRLGTALYSCRGDRTMLRKKEIFLFQNASELRTEQTRQYTNGVYTGTSFSFRWENSGKTVYHLGGGYHSEDGTPKPEDDFNFARSAEIVWSNYLLEKANEEFRRTGCIQFNLDGRDCVRVGDGFVELCMDGKSERCTASEIESVSLAEGEFKVKKVGAKEGWFSSRGVFKFKYSTMANARLFLLALDKLAGFRFS